ncbi:hypothetical protein OF83DRAFT_863380 [Amylostereum chailletii]|nr:hypothetical protein OF83DRAFT_863380 [Amylostereum chailletii]
MATGIMQDPLSASADSSSAGPRFRPFSSPNHSVVKSRYITSNDPRGYIPVYEYPLNGQWIMMDVDDGYVLWTGIWKALGNSKADIVKMVESQPDLASQIRRVRGGYLKIQGTWMPYEVALRLSRRVAWPIRDDLVPLFGPTFPSTCLSPDQPGYGQVIANGQGRRRPRRSTHAANAHAQAAHMQTSVFSAHAHVGAWSTAPSAPVEFAHPASVAHSPSSPRAHAYAGPASAPPYPQAAQASGADRQRASSSRYSPYGHGHGYSGNSPVSPRASSAYPAFPDDVTLPPIQHPSRANAVLPPISALADASSSSSQAHDRDAEGLAVLERLRMDDDPPRSHPYSHSRPPSLSVSASYPSSPYIDHAARRPSLDAHADPHWRSHAHSNAAPPSPSPSPSYSYSLAPSPVSASPVTPPQMHAHAHSHPQPTHLHPSHALPPLKMFDAPPVAEYARAPYGIERGPHRLW